ncbi:MAG: hypothetical protein Q8Q08_12840 [Candidatus Omnitrophota bacterium]|nr:hypothetical protein [Candidatus Omnitrophota bacterium]
MVDPMLKAVIVCKEMGWDWYTYLSQPSWMPEVLDLIHQAEAQVSKNRSD